MLGLDVGTTGVKAIVFDLDGNIKGYGFREYNIIYEKPCYAEQDSEHVWELTKCAIRDAVSKSGKREIKAISLSAQGDAVIPVNSETRPLHNAILGMDYRSSAQADECAKLFGDRNLFNITGMRPHPMNSLTKILWIKQNAPEIYQKTYKFMTYADFILSKLGAEPSIDFTMASRTMAFELQSTQWSENILNKVGVDDALFSKAVLSGETVGEIYPSIACELGITRGALLVAGGHDQTCAALGAGVSEEKIAIDSHGTAEVLSTAFEKTMLNDKMYDSYYPCYCHAKAGMYLTFSLNHIGGALFAWYRDNLGYAEVQEAEQLGINTFQLMEGKAPKGPSPVFVLPHFNGSGTPWCDLESKGAFLGLTMSTTRHDIVKGILDSLTYELRVNIETMRAAGIGINQLRAVGGAAKSKIWLQIKADVTGCSIATLKVREAACLGAAMIAGVAAGGYKNIEEAVKRTVALKDVYYPDPEMSKVYSEKYYIYKEIYSALEKINKKI